MKHLTDVGEKDNFLWLLHNKGAPRGWKNPHSMLTEMIGGT